MRITHFDKSNAFGFGKKEDYNLGKLADENKKDMQKAIRHIPDFRKTNVGFNKRKQDEFDTADIYFKGAKNHPKSPVFKAGAGKQVDLFATTKQPWFNNSNANVNSRRENSHVKTESNIVPTDTKMRKDIEPNSARPKTN